MNFECEICKKPFDNSRGYSNHKVQGTCGEAGQRLLRRDNRQTPTFAPLPPVAGPGPAALGDSSSGGGGEFSDIDALLDHLTGNPEVPEPNVTEEFQPPSPLSSLEEEDDDRESGKVRVGDTTALPEVVAEQMFRKPKGFGTGWLKSTVGNEGVPCFTPDFDKTMSDEEKSSIHLLRVLDGKELSLFDQIQAWKHQSDTDYAGGGAAPGRQGPPTRKGTIKGLMQHFGFSGLLPQSKKFELPNTGVLVDLQVFSFGNMLLSLLTDPVAMLPENLSFDPQDPFAEPIVGGKDGNFEDFNTGTVHCMAHKTHCTGARDILCELTLFIDKTHLDVKGKHTLEPVMFTLGIFNRAFRNQHKAWRPLGYLPNLDQLAPHSKPDQKQRDYHLCLRIILSELVAYQRLGGVGWDLAFENLEIENICFQIPVNCVVGDNEGHDKLLAKVGRATGSSMLGRKVCRSCDVSWEFLGKPLDARKRKDTKCAHIRRWRNIVGGAHSSDQQRSDCRQKLRDSGYKDFHDGMVDVHFSDSERALHGATPAEILHTFQLGLAERSIQACFGAKKMLKSRRKPKFRSRKRKFKEEESSDEEEDSEEDSEEEEDGSEDEEEDSEEEVVDDDQPQTVAEDMISTNSVFTDKAKQQVDATARKLHRFLKWQSDKDLPRTAFPRGITNLAKMQGNERTGVLVLLLIIMIMDHWSFWRLQRPKGGASKEPSVPAGTPGHFHSALGVTRATDIVQGLYWLISFEAFMSCASIPCDTLSKVEKFIPLLLAQMHRAFPRTSGDGTNLLKNHLPLHLAEDIRRFGSPKNVDSGIGESVHKTSAKKTGQRTNMSADSFERQTGKNYTENLTVERAHAFHPNWSGSKAPQQSEVDELTGRCLTIGKDCLRDSRGCKARTLPLWPNSHCSPETIRDFVRQTVLPAMPKANEVTIFTKLTRQDHAFSANPSFGTTGLSKQDWALVNMEGEEVPCHLLCLVEIPETPCPPINLNGSLVGEAGPHFLVHCAISHMKETGSALWGGDQGTLAHVDQRLVHRIPKGHLDTNSDWVGASDGQPPSLLLVSPKELAGPCVGFPDLDLDSSNCDWFFLRPRSEWASIFQEVAVRGRL